MPLWQRALRADPEEPAIHTEADAALWRAVNALIDGFVNPLDRLPPMPAAEEP